MHCEECDCEIDPEADEVYAGMNGESLCFDCYEGQQTSPQEGG